MSRFLLLLKFVVLASTLFYKSEILAAPPSCGADTPCNDGYYCSGAVGDTPSGVCVANSMNIAMCRFVDYVNSDILPYFFLFGAGFAGILMFIGKFTIMSLMQILLGIGVLYGGKTILGTVIGDPSGLCSSSDAANCAAATTGSKTISSSGVILNLSTTVVDPKYDSQLLQGGTATQCGLLQCVQASCDSYTFAIIATTDSITGVVTNKKQYTINMTSGVPNPVIATVLGTTPGNITMAIGGGSNDNNSITVTCRPISATYNRDYFTCTNTCTNTDYGGEAPVSWNLPDCAALAIKKLNQQ